jgi:hypothetical protein
MEEPLTIEWMRGDIGTGVLRYSGVVADVIPVAVARHDELQRPLTRRELIGDPAQARHRGVDRDRLARTFIRKDVDIRRKGTDDAVQVFHPTSVAFVAG